MISRPLLRTIPISPPTVLAAQSSILNSESPRQRNDSSPSPGNNLHIFWIRSQLNPVSLIHIRSAAENVLCLTSNYNLGLRIVVVSLILTFVKRCVKKMVRERKPNGRYFENWVSPIFQGSSSPPGRYEAICPAHIQARHHCTVTAFNPLPFYNCICLFLLIFC